MDKGFRMRRLVAGSIAISAMLIQGSALRSAQASQVPSPVSVPQTPGAPGGSSSPPPAFSVPSCPELAAALRAVATNDGRLKDWANLGRYREANRAVRHADVVFLGDSIFDNWVQPRFGEFFPGKDYIDRGIAGQTTPQMLVRMRPDVLALKPRAVIILAGVNDIANATGPMTNDEITGNLESMAQLASNNGVKVILSSILPTGDYHRPNPNAVPKTTLHPIERIRELNQWIRKYAADQRYAYADFYSAVVDARGVLREDLSTDDVHPNAAGYAIMAPIAQKAIDQALR